MAHFITEGFEDLLMIGGQQRPDLFALHIEKADPLPEIVVGVRERLAADGKTPMYLAVNGKAAGLIAVADTIKESSKDAVSAMHDMGLTVAMMTGDNRATAHAIARVAGIDEVKQEVQEIVDFFRARNSDLEVIEEGDGASPMATERWKPPVQPTAMVRRVLPSAR